MKRSYAVRCGIALAAMVVGALALPAVGSAGGPGLLLAAGDGTLWASDDSGRVPGVFQLDPGSGSILRRPRPSQRYPVALAVGGGAAWIGSVANGYVAGALTRVDLKTGRTTTRLRLPGQGVFSLAASDAAAWVTVGSRVRTTLRINLRTGLPVSTVKGANDPTLMVADASGLWFTDQGDWLFHAFSAEAVAHRVILTTRGASALAAGFGSVWIGDVESSLFRIDEHTGEPAARLRLPAQPVAIAVTRTTVWALTSDVRGTSRLVKIDPRSNTVVASRKLPRPARTIAVSEGAVFVGWTAGTASAPLPEIVRVDPITLALHPLASLQQPTREPSVTRPRWKALVDHVPGFSIRYPQGWTAQIRDDDSVVLDSGMPPGWPFTQTRATPGAVGIWLGDGGRQQPPSPLRSLRLTLPPVASYEGFGPASRLQFDVGGHDFLAYVAFGPHPTPAARDAVLAVLASVTPTRPPLHPYARSYVLGHSAQGRPIRAFRYGDSTSPRKILIVGCIHGTECAGLAITRALIDNPTGVRDDLWIIQNLNPDGLALRQRTNAHGVDLNRNFPRDWTATAPGGPEYPGPRPLSEPEARVASDLINRIRPQLTIWFHQPVDIVRAYGASIPVAKRFARLVGLPFRKLPWLPGTAPNWQNHRYPGTTSFVVELPIGSLTPTQASRYATAILTLAGR